MDKKEVLVMSLQSDNGKAILNHLDEYILNGNYSSLEGLKELNNLRAYLLKIQKMEKN